MAKATEEENLLSYFDFKEKLEKKIKKKDQENEAYDYDFDEKKEEAYVPDWAKEDFEDVKPKKKKVNVDKELAKMIDDKEDENKELEDKHKEEIEEEIEEGDDNE